MGGGKFTTTAGLYFSQQKMNMYWDFLTYVQDLAGGGNSALVDVYTAGGAPVTQGGITSYALGAAPTYHRRYDTKHRILAPYGSVNFHIGKIALGASLRYDTGRVRGQLFSVDLGEGRVGSAAIDMNGDGVIVPIETDVTILPLGEPGPVHYNYHYLSYSVSANYRVADQFSVFGRYSRGARAGADRLLFPPSQDAATGRLTDPSTAFGYVKQAEVGAKYRTDHLSVFVTGFWASTSDKNYQIAADETGQTVVIPINRSYSAKGIELEAEARTGPFSLSLGATYTKAKIGRDEADPAIEGNRPRHQPDLFFYARPQFETERFTVGTSINGTTSSFAQDSNLLKQPGYVIFSPFVQIRPNGRMQIALNAFNVFDKMAFVQVGAPVVPASGIVNAQVLNGRTVTASVRVSF
ncbi:MAG: TonB-dependent receptor [Novosphingobium sp.]